MTNAQLFIAKFKEAGLEEALRAVGVDPNAEDVRLLKLSRMSGAGREIVLAVAAELDIPMSAIMARSRRMEFFEVRVEVMRRMRALGWSYPRIGREMGKNHSTVMEALGATKRAQAKRAAQRAPEALKAVG